VYDGVVEIIAVSKVDEVIVCILKLKADYSSEIIIPVEGVTARNMYITVA
jgi:hypothetical protein